MLDNFTKQSFQLNFVLFFLITRGTFITTSEVKATITFPIKKYKFSLIRQNCWLAPTDKLYYGFIFAHFKKISHRLKSKQTYT